MLKFTYRVELKKLEPFGDHVPVEDFKGEIEAENYEKAKGRACSLARARCDQLSATRGGRFGYDSNELRLQYQPEAPTTMTAEQIIAMIERRMDQAERESNLADAAYCKAETESGRTATYLRVHDAAVEHTLLNSILREINSRVIIIHKLPEPDRKRTQPLVGREEQAWT